MRTLYNIIGGRRWVALVSLLVCCVSFSVAQIRIGGNVYGGGNAGDLTGHTEVVVRSGDLRGSVYGGARQANVGKHTFVHIDGEHLSDDVTINYVYGGNDISGTVGAGLTATDDLPEALTTVTEGTHAGRAVDYGLTDATGAAAGQNKKVYDSFILTTPERTETSGGVTTTPYHIFIGQMYGGGNGAYTYTATPNAEGLYEAKSGADVVATSAAAFTAPEVSKVYQEVRGGTFGYVYAGGNSATVREAANICIANSSEPMVSNRHLGTLPENAIRTNLYSQGEPGTDGYVQGELDKPTNQRLMDMGINLTTWTRGYNFLRVFGGNNQVAMHIRPTWHLEAGKINNLYSGGNQGAMTSKDGILLEIMATSAIDVQNVFGGCRMADVTPLNDDGTPVEELEHLAGYNFPTDLAARVLVRGGTVKNVYGGNDITGSVWGGTAVGIYTSVSGDVYGGGNGSYPYTDTPEFVGDVLYGDYYYDPSKGTSSADALNQHRPNAEQVSIRVFGTETKPTIIHGSLYLGGNSATLVKSAKKPNPKVELKIGSYSIINSVFLGNNGANMVDPSVGYILWQYAQKGMHYQDGREESSKTVGYNTMDLKSGETFATYMKGCEMPLIPRVVFDNVDNGDPATYIPYSSSIGSFFCGGNVGSMNIDGVIPIDFTHQVIIYDKLVGGCNRAFVPKTTYNAAYDGGLLGAKHATTGNKLELTLNGLEIQPKRWAMDGEAYKTDANGNHYLEWNTVKASTGADTTVPDEIPTGGTPAAADKDRRLKGGNVYGGCYESGHVDGNVVINVNATLMDRDKLFDAIDHEGGEPKLYDGNYKITERRTGVILDEQGMDVLGSALNVFGGGYGKDSEIWGSTTVNLNKGYVFQVFGGGEQGAIGQSARNSDTGALTYSYTRDAAYSTTINLRGTIAGAARGSAGDSPDMAEAEFIYGGGFEGVIAGDTHVYLGNGRIFNSFAGSCNADILGHTETYVGLNTSAANDQGFPWVCDHIYGGNDLGGRILGEADLSGRVSSINSAEANSQRYTPTGDGATQPTTASAYVEYRQGRVENIFGGCYGDYDYSASAYVSRVTYKPYLNNAFVNLRPENHGDNALLKVFGAGQGQSGVREGDESQDRSYVLVDIPQSMEKYQATEVFGAGAYDGLGMRFDPSDDDEKVTAANSDKATAIIDLIHGQLGNVYGGSYNEGNTRRTLVNVPAGSTIKVGKVFGGAYGNSTVMPCDVYEWNVNYNSVDAVVTALYGGNNSERRTVYAKVNIGSKVYSNKEKGYTASVYGAGYGANTWAEYTEVNLNSGAEVYEVYGGGEAGKVFNAESVQAYMQAYQTTQPAGFSYTPEKWATVWPNAWKFGKYYTPDAGFTNYYTDTDFNLENTLARTAEMDDRDYSGYSAEERGKRQYKYNTNVIIHDGATVSGYVYGGGLGATATVAGTTYVALLGGTVVKDLYAAGTSGDVEDMMRVGSYNASTNPDGFTAGCHAYILGGTARNVYGGGWEGDVGHHEGAISDSRANDVDGETHVVIGVADAASTYASGDPAILRSVYGGGEGGSVFGTAHVTLHNGHIGYRYMPASGTYTEEVDDSEAGDNELDMAGNIFGGGYVANSFTDHSYIKMYGGQVRGSLYGGGEIGPIGRGTCQSGAPTANAVRTHADYTPGETCVIYKGGTTKIELYGGHVLRDVFGGGRGFDNWGGDGTMYMSEAVKSTLDLSLKGYVFGSTDVRIRGGEVGTAANVAQGYGNVFGGGNVGYVFSATGSKHGTRAGATDLVNGLPREGGGYFYEVWDSGTPSNSRLSHDCAVVVEPYCRVTDAGGVTFTAQAANASQGLAEVKSSYAKGEYVPVEALNQLRKKDVDSRWDAIDGESGVTIHNAVFAGGNVTIGSDQLYVNTGTVYGNVTASLRDVYNRDLITVGTEHTGGLYGDGNLTMVDGYREVHVDNYGTDYYSLSQEVTKEQYLAMSDRERAYFVLNYKCLKDCVGKNGSIAEGSRLTSDQFKEAFDYDNYGKEGYPEAYKAIINADGTPNSAYFEELGFCSIYAGRLLNTIQRCDMAAIYGSRIVLQGARDRVPEKADFTLYTLNRVGELSLNQRKTQATGEALDNQKHGNYFGIYSVVHYLGNLTSDVFFTKNKAESTNPDYVSIRTTDSSNENNKASTTYNDRTTEYGETTYYEWKAARPKEANRNNATSPNKVSLASGVYLELIREESETLPETSWGYITGVVELDLIDVKTGLGGGYVYAKNEHGVKTWNSGWDKVNLSPYNLTARTYKRFTYDETESSLLDFETSGNFVHNTKQIVDDCWPNANAYKGSGASPAHYYPWRHPLHRGSGGR